MRGIRLAAMIGAKMSLFGSIRVEDTGTAIVDGAVPVEQQTMALENVFWSHFSRNLGPAGWVIGVLAASLGLGFWWGLAAILVGNLLGSVPVALCALMGPQTGLTQMEDSRFAFGQAGTRLPSLINWICCVSWDAVNNVPSTIALIALLAIYGVSAPFWLALATLAILQMIGSVYGHDLVQLVEKYLGYLLLVVFGLVGYLAVAHGGSTPGPTQPVTLATVVLAISLVASFNMAWAPYSADYTRYLPKTTAPWKIFVLAFAAMMSSGILIELCGLLTANAIPDTTPSGLIKSIATLTGGFAPLALFAVAISSVAVNSQNDNTAAYSLISAGLKLPRWVSAIITATLGFIIAVAGSGQFATLYSNYLLVLVYWVSPWLGIVLADWYLHRKNGLETTYSTGWTLGATIFVSVTLLTIALFSSTSVYTGPIAKLLGGTDIGYFVGFIAAAGAYVLLRSRCPDRRRLAPRHRRTRRAARDRAADPRGQHRPRLHLSERDRHLAADRRRALPPLGEILRPPRRREAGTRDAGQAPGQPERRLRPARARTRRSIDAQRHQRSARPLPERRLHRRRVSAVGRRPRIVRRGAAARRVRGLSRAVHARGKRHLARVRDRLRHGA
jgi:NCS1 family nucleobase:cation symporter-1